MRLIEKNAKKNELGRKITSIGNELHEKKNRFHKKTRSHTWSGNLRDIKK